MRRGLLTAAVVAAAVLVPTAVLSDSGQAFSVQQVMRVFAAEGLPLRRQPMPVVSIPFELFWHNAPDRGIALDVMVYRPGATLPPREGRFVAYPSSLPRFARRGNVIVSELMQRDGSAAWQAVLRALAGLRYSPADAARPQLPTIVLRRGEQRTLTRRQAPVGTEVECPTGRALAVSYGTYPSVAAASTVIEPTTRRRGSATNVTFGSGSGPTREAQLSWQPVRHGAAVDFTCSASVSSGQVVANQVPPLPPPLPPVHGPLPRLRLPRATFTLGNEYASVPAPTRRAMLGAR